MTDDDDDATMKQYEKDLKEFQDGPQRKKPEVKKVTPPEVKKKDDEDDEENSPEKEAKLRSKKLRPLIVDHNSDDEKRIGTDGLQIPLPGETV